MLDLSHPSIRLLALRLGSPPMPRRAIRQYTSVPTFRGRAYAVDGTGTVVVLGDPHQPGQRADVTAVVTVDNGKEHRPLLVDNAGELLLVRIHKLTDGRVEKVGVYVPFPLPGSEDPFSYAQLHRIRPLSIVEFILRKCRKLCTGTHICIK
jgi:hypothetical protein